MGISQGQNVRPVGWRLNGMTTMTDDEFRQRLRDHHRVLTRRLYAEKPGSRAWFKLDAAMRSTDALYLEVFREAMDPVHCQPAYVGGTSPDSRTPPG